MRILSVFFHPSSNFAAVGGAERRFVEVLKAWNTEDVRVTVVDSDPKLISKKLVNCRVVGMPSPLRFPGKGLLHIYLEWVSWIIKACLLCPKLMRHQEYDVILAPNNTLPNLIVASLLHVVSGVPLCVTVHHMDFSHADKSANFSSVYREYREAGFNLPVAFIKTTAFFMILTLLRQPDLCIAVSRYTAAFLSNNGIAPCRILVSGNGVDVDLIESIVVSGRKVYDGVFVGRIAREKGIFDLVALWKKIVSHRPESKLVVIGSGPDVSELRDVIEALGMGSQVMLKGYCDDRTLYGLMKTSKAFLFPSVFEGWGLAVGEALACGLPVVCYDIPALREVFGQCPSVFFVPVGNTRRFAETVEKILEEGRLAEYETVSKKYAERFSWKKVAAKDLEVIRKMIHLDDCTTQKSF
jgi:glycosyltransferase involved in cell wall biosynthesis